MPPELSQRDTSTAWEAAVVASGLPVAVGDAAKPKPRLAFGAPLPVGMAAEAELIDVVLTERLAAWRVREALDAPPPGGLDAGRLADVWLGGPPLAGRVVAADYRVTLGGTSDAAALEVAATELLEARTLLRERLKGDGVVRYDLRPLLIDVRVVGAGSPVVADPHPIPPGARDRPARGGRPGPR